MNNNTFTALGVGIPFPNVNDIRIKGIPSGGGSLSWTTQSMVNGFIDNAYCDLGIRFFSNTIAYAVGQYQTICMWTSGSALQATCQGDDTYRSTGCCSGADYSRTCCD